MRVYNFSAGPATLPLAVLERAQSEMIDYRGSGMSVMEMSHRTPIYESILFGARDGLRRLMRVPDSYEILFLQGGASLQFAMVPLNLMHTGKADYIQSGAFAKKAYEEAARVGDAAVVASSKDRAFRYVPQPSPEALRPDASYVHMTTNNTIYGTSARAQLPPTNGLPLVADMSSNILGETYDVENFGLIYAGAQKNIGPAGLTIAVIRKDLLALSARKDLSPMLTYRTYAENDSMYNTPPTYAVYLAGLVFEHIEEQGGVASMQRQNEAKAAALYAALDRTPFYTPFADKEYRSIMNVTFTTPNPELDQAFCDEAAKEGLLNLKGHRATGGIRASLYNAMTLEGVTALIDFMDRFAKLRG